jgi:hypothetical protein
MQAAIKQKMMFFPDCFTVIEHASRLMVGTLRIVVGAA